VKQGSVTQFDNCWQVPVAVVPHVIVPGFVPQAQGWRIAVEQVVQSIGATHWYSDQVQVPEADEQTPPTLF